MTQLDAATLDALADRVAARVITHLAAHEPSAAPVTNYVDAATLADRLGVDRAYVYEHADQLGAIRLGNGPRARLRFNVETARDALTDTPRPDHETPRSPRRRHASPAPEPGHILQPRPRGARP